MCNSIYFKIIHYVLRDMLFIPHPRHDTIIALFKLFIYEFDLNLLWEVFSCSLNSFLELDLFDTF